MKTFTVYQLPNQEAPTFVKEGFCWLGFVFPWLAALRFRLFRFFLALLFYHFALVQMNRAMVIPLGLHVCLFLFIHIFAGMCILDFWQNKLERGGAKVLGVVLAPSLLEAQLRYFQQVQDQDAETTQAEGTVGGGAVKVAGHLPKSN